jgi:nucleotide-binding universal stress UspA family protein
MADVVVLCADGSEVSIAALRAGMAVVRPGAEMVVATVIEPPDTALVTGTGMAGGTLSPETFAGIEQARADDATAALERTVVALGLDGARTEVLHGHPGTTLCEFAASEQAVAMVIGSRGRGGLRRAVMGSVSDHVVRHAPCPVVVTTPAN